MKITSLLFWCVTLTILSSVAMGETTNTDPSFISHPDYFWGGQAQASTLSVWDKGQLVPLGQLAPDEILRVRTELETLWQSNPSQVPGGETEIRKMLRAIRYLQGPLASSNKPYCWSLNAVVMPSVDIPWTDSQGNPQHYQAGVRDPHKWVRWVAREMSFLRKIIYVASWGKILIRPRVAIAKIPLTKVVNLDGAYFIDPVNGSQVLQSAIPGESARGWMGFLPSEGTGEFPPSGDVAYSFADPSIMNGSVMTAVPTTEARLKQPHGWAETGCCGLMHEFWQHVHQWMEVKVNFTGFIPDNDTPSDVTLIDNEIASQGLPAPYMFYADFFGSYPTRKMLEDSDDCRD